MDSCDGNSSPYHLILFVDGIPAPFLGVRFHNKIIALAVSKEYRRKGIGTTLLKTAEQWAKENNIEVILLNSGLPRKDAHAFYESQGYFKKSYGFIKKILVNCKMKLDT